MSPIAGSVRSHLAVLLLAGALVGCRQIAELPAEGPAAGGTDGAGAAEGRPPVWLASEAAVFEHAQSVLESAGAPEVRTAVLQVSDDVDLPIYRPEIRTLVVPPFRDGEERMRERLARTSARRFEGALGFVDRFDSAASAYEGWAVLLTVAVAHELWHHVQSVRAARSPVAPDPHAPPAAAATSPATAASSAASAAPPSATPASSSSPGEASAAHPEPDMHVHTGVYDREMEAIEVEQAFLRQLVAAKQVPARWIDQYRRAVAAFREAVPRRDLDALPADEAARRRRFTEAVAVYGAGEAAARGVGGFNVEVSAGFTVFAVYLDRRMSLLASSAAPRALADLVRR